MRPSPLYLVTSNNQKAREIRAALQPYGIDLRVKAIDVPETKDLNIRQVVITKAEAAYARLQKPVLVDDTGIFFVGYRNFPGAYSKFAFQALGFAGIWRLLRGPARAYFCSYVAYKQSRRAPVHLFRGYCHGRLVRHRRGRRKPKMPYDCIFIPDGDCYTFAQMTVAEKQRYDHRSKAIRQFANYYLRAQP